MKIGVIGSRVFPRLDLVRAYVLSLPRDVLIITGGARGVDRTAEQAAIERRLSRLIYEPKCEESDPNYVAELRARNTLIVEACDMLIAFHDGVSRGTMSTMQKARVWGKRVEVRGIE